MKDEVLVDVKNVGLASDSVNEPESRRSVGSGYKPDSEYELNLSDFALFLLNNPE